MPLPELVAPAGSFACVTAAIRHGADAVYIGLERFSLRAHSPNFSIEQAGEAFEYAHAENRRIYVVLNTMPWNAHLGQIRQLLQRLCALPHLPDAIVVSDPGVLSLCRTIVPQCPLHLSTQTGTFNTEAARFWARQGIRRVVLPREMTLEQVHEITAQAPVQTEVFVHGAMCVSISGRCLLGGYLSRRHANQGDCPQPCRLKYRLVPEEGEENTFFCEEDAEGTYFLNSCDLNALPILDRVVDSGVSALKIEGRNKSEHYISSVVKVYRSALDALAQGPGAYRVEPWWTEELERVDHRKYTTGFYAGETVLQDVSRSKRAQRTRMVGMVRESVEGARHLVDVRNPFAAGELLQLVPVGRKRTIEPVRVGKITDLAGNALERAPTNRIVFIAADRRLRPGDILRRPMD